MYYKFSLKSIRVKLQYTTTRRFRMGSARFANKPTQTQNTNLKYEQTQNTKEFRSPRLQGAVYCNLASTRNIFLSILQSITIYNWNKL